MSKREAAWKLYEASLENQEYSDQLSFDAGYEAAIAAVETMGPVCRYTGAGVVEIEEGKFLTVHEPLYRLPEKL